MRDQSKYLSLSEAAKYLGVSRVTVWRRIRDGTLASYQASTSRREKLVRRRDLDELRRPRQVIPLRYKVRHARGPTERTRRQPPT